jgi:hypothetical protein
LATPRSFGPADAPELGEERTVSADEWRGMHGEGALLSLPEPPREGEAWTDPSWGLWFVAEAGPDSAVFERVGGTERVEVPLGPDGQPYDGQGWSRVDLGTQGEAEESWRGY